MREIKIFLTTVLILLWQNAFADYEKGLDEFKNKNFESAIEYWEKSANDGNSKSLYQLGIIYGAGKHVDRDTDKSYKYFSDASALGNADATFALYAIHRMAKSSLSYAFKYLDLAIKQGSEKAKVELVKIQAVSNGKYAFNSLVFEQNELVKINFDINDKEVSRDIIDRGKEIYKNSCFVCHSTGAAGAPVVGKRDQWKSRIAKGRQILLNNSIKGINAMPPRGGRGDLDNNSILAAILYMIEESK